MQEKLNSQLFFIVVLIAVTFASGCGVGVKVYRKHPRTAVVVAPVPPPTVYVAQDPSSHLPGQKQVKSELLQVSENGTWLAIGKIWNYCQPAKVLHTGSVEVCYGSELRTDRPPQEDPCWLPLGAFTHVVIPPFGGQTPWLRVRSNGGVINFSVDTAGGWGGTTRSNIPLVVDFWGKDGWCPGNQIVDFSWEMCNSPEQRQCRPTRFMR